MVDDDDATATAGEEEEEEEEEEEVEEGLEVAVIATTLSTLCMAAEPRGEGVCLTGVLERVRRVHWRVFKGCI